MLPIDTAAPLPSQTTPFNVIDELQHLPVEDIQAESQRRHLPFAVALMNLTGDLNVGIIIRSACVFAAERVFLFGRKRYDRRSTVGAHNYIDVQHHDVSTANGQIDWLLAMDTIRVNGYTPILIEQGGTSIHELDPLSHEKVCLVVGPEDLGIPSLLCATEQTYTIPQYGVCRSLNVSTAAGIAIQMVSSRLQSHCLNK